MELRETEGAIEAILFTMGESVELSRIAEAVEQDKETTRKILQHMMDKYRGGRPWDPDHRTGWFYQLCTKKVYYDTLIRLTAQPKKQC